MLRKATIIYNVDFFLSFSFSIEQSGSSMFGWARYYLSGNIRDIIEKKFPCASVHENTDKTIFAEMKDLTHHIYKWPAENG